MTGDPSWLSLSEAANLLGVHFTTVRRWADQGQLEYLRTPGGKRKFQRKAIEEFLDRHRSPVQIPTGLSRLSDAAVVKTREDFHSQGMANQNWFLRMSEEQRQYMRGTGNQIIALMVQYCAREENGVAFLEEAKRIASDYGQMCCRMGLSPAECVQMFLFFRRPILNSVHETGSTHGKGDGNDRRLFQKMSEFLDDFLVAMVAAYHQSASQPIPIDR